MKRWMSVVVLAALGAQACGSGEDSEGGSEDESVIATAEALGSASTEPLATEAPAESEPAAVPEPEETEAPAEPEESEPPAEPEEPTGDAVTVEDSGFVTYEALGELWINAGALIVNNTGEPLSFVDISFNFLDESGAPVATETAIVSYLPPEGSFPVSVIVVDDVTASPPSSVEINAFAELDPFFTVDEVELTLDTPSIGADSFGATLGGTVTNDTETVVSFGGVQCVLVRDDGTIAGGATAYLDPIVPGQSASWSTSGSEINAAVEQGATTASCRALGEVGDSAGSLATAGNVGFVTYEALDGELWANAAALITNDSDADLYYVEVTYNLLGADGNPAATESDIVEFIPAGGEAISAVTATSNMSANPPSSIEVTVFAEEDSFFSSDYIEVPVEPGTPSTEQFGASLGGTATNPADAPLEFVSVDCLLMTADGSTAGGVTAFVDAMAPGQAVAWDTSGSEIEAALEMGANSARCISYASLD